MMPVFGGLLSKLQQVDSTKNSCITESILRYPCIFSLLLFELLSENVNIVIFIF